MRIGIKTAGSSRILIVGLGPGSPADLPARNLEVLVRAESVFLRTAQHPLVRWLENRGVNFTALDQIYEKALSFGEVYERIVSAILDTAKSKENGVVAYAVPGHPMVAETSVRLILEKAGQSGIQVGVIGAMSSLDAIWAALRVDPSLGVAILDAQEFRSQNINTGWSLIITQLFNRRLASEIKLELLDLYPPDFEVTLVHSAGVEGQEKVERLPLYRLDHRQYCIDHLTTLYVPAWRENCLLEGIPEERKEPGGGCNFPLDPLTQVVSSLRGPDGCPWDKEQTHESLERYLIEECYEVIEAIEAGDPHKLCEELGDLLLQVVLHTQMAKENGLFDMNSVIDGITSKMVRRHPHVFGELKLETAGQVLVNWEKIKFLERSSVEVDVNNQNVDQAECSNRFLNIPRSLPALMQAQKIQERASRRGLDWPDVEGVRQKINEELQELDLAKEEDRRSAVAEEVGDLLFSIVNLARFLKLDAEAELRHAVEKFARRFAYLEDKAKSLGHKLEDSSLENLDDWWQEAKKESEKPKISLSGAKAGRKRADCSE